MGFPSIRKKTGYDSGVKIAGYPISGYETVKDSIEDFVLYMEHFNFPGNLATVEDFTREMKNNGYFEDTYENYLNGVKRFI